MAHKWTGIGTLSRVGGTDIEPGEEFEPTDAELESFAARIEDIEEDTPDETEDASAESEEEAQTPDESAEDAPGVEALADEHWSTVVSKVESGELDGMLEELQEVDGRSSVQEAISERLE